MSEYTPTTEEVKIKYRLSSGNGVESPAEFDRWLDSIKAEAWREGAESAFYNPEIRGFVDYPEENPYRLLVAEFEGEK